MRSYLYFFLLVLGLTQWSCFSESTDDIRAYYFPVEHFRKGQVYEYEVTQNGITAPEYWYFRGFQRDSGLFLAATYYDQGFQIGPIAREKITEKSVLLRSYFFYEIDSTRLNEENGGQVQSEASIDQATVFPFEVEDSAKVYEFALRYRPATDPGTEVEIRRERRYLGAAPDFEFRGKKIKCIRFSLREIVGNSDTRLPELSATGEEWYAKGLGKVYYRKTYGDGAVSIEATLKDIFPMAELERRAAEVLGE
ncbi:MAG: hypothetical protein IT269_04590 [Saprospiraceae bacterium]|nr:hypothetical protein [Saprospiraceae bacterium]